MLLKTDLKKIPYLNTITEIAEKSQADVFFVGGCVRDMLLGRDVTDVDIVAFGTDYEKFAFSLAGKLRAAAVKFKDNVRIAKNGTELDVSAPRGANIVEDLAKRDFTINNLALNIKGQIIGDDTDIRKGLIIAVHNAVFDDDPLRVLRAFRFSSQLGFKIDENTEKLAIIKSPLLENIAAERIFSEMKKLCEGKNASEVLAALTACGILKIIAGTSDEDEKWLMKALPSLNTNDFFIKTSAFIYGLRPDSQKIMENKCFPAKMIKKIRNTVMAFRMLEFCTDLRTDELKKFLFHFREDKENALDMFAAINGGGEELSEAFANTEKDMYFDKENLVDGAFLSTMGVPAGRLMGDIIKDVSIKLVCGNLKTIKEAAEYIRNTYGERIDETAKIQNRQS